MALVLTLSIIAIISMIVLILKFPVIKIGKIKIDSFFVPILIVALIFLIFPIYDKSETFNTLTSNTSLNPLKILILFISMSFISIVLDESGFFGYLANVFITKYKSSQMKLFITLYILISIVTIFTSNDIIILTFTPFIISFSKKGKINPIPYLFMEFVAANTYSILLEIGNPTNIYLSSVFSISFIDYLIKMIIPVIFIGISSFLTLILLFRKQLKKPIESFETNEEKIKDKYIMYVSLIHLILTIIILAISNYLNFEMYLITFSFALSLFLFVSIYSIIKKKKIILFNSIKRIPFTLIPFILSMFVIIMALDSVSIFDKIGALVNNINNQNLQSFIYLLSSTISSNVVNNIPMTLAYSKILNNNLYNILATIIGSNLGAILTPMGALAGIMFMKIVNINKIEFKFITFVKYGVIVTVVSILFGFMSLLLI